MNYSPKGSRHQSQCWMVSGGGAKGWLGRQAPVSNVVFFRSLWSRQRGDDGLRASGCLSRHYICMDSMLLTDGVWWKEVWQTSDGHCCSNREQELFVFVVQEFASFEHVLWQNHKILPHWDICCGSCFCCGRNRSARDAECSTRTGCNWQSLCWSLYSAQPLLSWWQSLVFYLCGRLCSIDSSWRG